MKIAVFAAILIASTGIYGQSFGPPCMDPDLMAAKSYFVVHNEKTPANHRKKIESRLNRASDLKLAKSVEKSDLVIDLSESGWMNVWRFGADRERVDLGRWSLVEKNTSFVLPARAHTTVVSAGKVTTARTTITPPRTARSYIPGDIGTPSEYLFQLRVSRQQYKKSPVRCE